MSDREQVVQIAPRATSFTALCVECAGVECAGVECAGFDGAEGYSSSTFAGRLDLDLAHGTFLCRRGHSVRVERAPATLSADAA